MDMFKKMPEIKNEFAESANIVLHCGDTLNFLGTIPKETFSLIITSPPYNIGKAYEVTDEYRRVS